MFLNCALLINTVATNTINIAHTIAIGMTTDREEKSGSFVSSGCLPSIGGVVFGTGVENIVDSVVEKRTVDSIESDDVDCLTGIEDITADSVDDNW